MNYEIYHCSLPCESFKNSRYSLELDSIFQLLLLAYDIGLLRNFSKVILSLSLLSENDFVNISEAVKNF